MIVDQAQIVWAIANGTLKPAQLQRYIETGSFGPLVKECIEYSPEVMEILAANLEKAYGGKE